MSGRAFPSLSNDIVKDEDGREPDEGEARDHSLVPRLPHGRVEGLDLRPPLSGCDVGEVRSAEGDSGGGSSPVSDHALLCGATEADELVLEGGGVFGGTVAAAAAPAARGRG